jgi:pimeloyl-ACP methyl ester carboxylesterase
MAPIIKSIELPHRVKLPYVEQGDPSGLPMLLLHGFTDSWYSFEPVLPHLPESIHAFALTQRGHGDADHPAAGYRTRDFAADVMAFADALGLGPVIVAGHSMGSINAQRFAIDHPERVLGLALAGSFATCHGNPTLVDLWQSGVSQLTDPIDPSFVREFQESTLAQPVSPAFLDTVVQESLKVPARVWQAALKESWRTILRASWTRSRHPRSLSGAGGIRSVLVTIRTLYRGLLQARDSWYTRMPGTRSTGRSRSASRLTLWALSRSLASERAARTIPTQLGIVF